MAPSFLQLEEFLRASPAVALPALAGALERAGVALFSGAAGAIQGLAGRSGEVTGQLLVTLIHERADDPAPIPSIPG